MAYTKTTWTSSTLMTTTNLNNAETQYDEGYAAAVAHNHDDRYYTKTEMDGWFWHAGNDGAGSGCDADMLYHADGNMHYADFGAGGVAQYTIIMWEDVALPSGWVLCDGTGGTPDLRDKFVIGAGGSKSVGASGGANTMTQDYTITVAAHTITEAELPAHTHTWNDTYDNNNSGRSGGDALSTSTVTAYGSGTTSAAGSGSSHGHTGSKATITATTNNNLPPCVALKYIMKS